MERIEDAPMNPNASARPERARHRRPSFTLIPDWVMLCERINPTAFRLWCILRSMQFEDGPGIPPMTLDQVCWLLPGVNGKPTSKTRARQALDVLLDEGLLVDVSIEGTARAEARSYLTRDAPQKAMGWPGARRKLARYYRTWRSR
ncbi:hypothetical protein ACFW2V_12490 [Streptomyces sp. NPDC058947]|uniref:hypothetical protein n=1 Tax=Streptomyces sp. NPDC058947 TaxID=3346675 RepID=UPI0036747A97